MSVTGSKRGKAESIMSTKSTGGKALDRHCFGITIKGKKCGGKKISGSNFCRHRKEDHKDQEDLKSEVCNKEGCLNC
jgi:hypothetical protein